MYYGYTFECGTACSPAELPLFTINTFPVCLYTMKGRVALLYVVFANIIDGVQMFMGSMESIWRMLLIFFFFCSKMCFIKHVKFSKSSFQISWNSSHCMPYQLNSCVFSPYIQSLSSITAHTVSCLPTSHGHDMTSDFITRLMFSHLYFFILTFLLG